MTMSRCWPLIGLLVVWSLSGCPRSKVSPESNAKGTYQAAALPGPPPWRVPSDAKARLSLAGLPLVQDAHHGAYHIHAGLRIYYDGKPVVIPAGIGLDKYDVPVSPVHTHRSTGVIHVEYPVPTTFKWGQFFALWGLSLGGSTVYLNAAPLSNLVDLPFADQQQVVIVFGAPPSTPIAWPTPAPEDGSNDPLLEHDGSEGLATPEPSAGASPSPEPTESP